MEKYYSPDQVAEFLNISAFTVRRWLKEGKLEAVKIERQWRVSETTLQEFLDSKRA